MTLSTRSRFGWLILVAGAVSGPKGCIVDIQDAIKKAMPVMEAAPVVAEA